MSSVQFVIETVLISSVWSFFSELNTPNSELLRGGATMKRCWWLIFIVSIFVVSQVNGQEIYRWVDEKGTLHFVDDLTQVPEKYRDQFQKKEPPKEPTPSPRRPPRKLKAIPNPTLLLFEKISRAGERIGGGPRRRSQMTNSRMPRKIMIQRTRPGRLKSSSGRTENSNPMARERD